MTDLTTKACMHCTQPAQQIINGQKWQRLGWWCPACNGWTPALLWEKEVEQDQQPVTTPRIRL